MRISDWSSDVCSSDLIEPDDHGYEYRAAIRFRVQDEWLGYYFPDEVRRAHHKVVGPQGADLVSSLGSEVVTRGTFGLSRRASCLDRALAVAPIAVPGGSFTPR